MGLYLDNAATTPLRPDVKQYIIDILDIYGNPSSVHQIGVQGRDIILTARKNVAKYAAIITIMSKISKVRLRKTMRSRKPFCVFG